MKYVSVIGLEIHIELDTQSKMFSYSSAHHFGKKANTNVDPVSLGLPGALPYPNKKAIDYTVMFGLALGCRINKFSKFDRKHYFYPDLPKGYQITQYDLPFCENGKYKLQNGKVINIKRIHLEEDTGKLQHKLVNGDKLSLVDFNRAGVPLVELVTEPDFESIEEAMDFLREIQLIVRYLSISSADMEKGSMRLEANVSVKKHSESIPSYKVELKNINSFKFLQNAVKYEVERQTELLLKNTTPIQETRGYDETTKTTFSQRSKEEAKDYRYFPEPDIPPIEFDDDYVKDLKKNLPVLPAVAREKLANLEVPAQYIETLIKNKDLLSLFIKTLENSKDSKIEPKKLADYMINQKVSPKSTPNEILDSLKLTSKKTSITLKKLETVCKQVIKDNPDAIAKYQAGKRQIIGFLIGQSQLILKGEGDSLMIKKVFEKLLQD